MGRVKRRIALVILLIGVLFPSFYCEASPRSGFAIERYTQEELRLLTAIIYCEARGEGYMGQKAVGIVVQNRVKSDLFPGSIEEVIYQKGQFSPVTDGNLELALNLYDQEGDKGEWDDTMQSCRNAAKIVLKGSREIELEDETYKMDDYLYFSRYVENARFQLGNHMFK